MVQTTYDPNEFDPYIDRKDGVRFGKKGGGKNNAAELLANSSTCHVDTYSNPCTWLLL
jgi:hypothetical protein